MSQNFSGKIQRPTNEEAEYILTKDAKTVEVIDFLERLKGYLIQEEWFLVEPSTEYQGIRYAERIIDGFVPSSEAVYKACERFLYELDRQHTDPNFPYTFDEEEAMRYIHFVEDYFKTVGLDSTAVPFIYQPHQHFYIGQIVGWKDHRGNRRFSNALELVGRGGGKTMALHPLPLYTMIQEGVISQKAMYLAGSKTQSKPLFNMVKTLIGNAEPVIQEIFKIRDEYIGVNGTGIESAYHLATTNAMSSHGGSANIVIADEVHTMKDPETLNTLIESMDKRYGSTVLYASTRSKGWSAMLETKVSRGQYVLEAYKTDETTDKELYYLGYIENIEEIKNLWSWFKANPNLMIQNIEAVIHKYKIITYEPEKIKDLEDGETPVDFYTQRFNFIDTSSEKAYLPPILIKKNQKMIDLAEIKGRDTYIGIDIGGYDDFTTVTAVTPVVLKGKDKGYLYVEGRSFITKTSYDKKVKDFKIYYPDIHRWVESGDLVIMDDHNANTTDLFNYIEELNKRYKIKAIGYDPYAFYGEIDEYIQESGYKQIAKSIQQKGSKYSNIVKEMRQKFANGEVIYNVNPLLTYYFRNAHINERENGLWTIGKGSTSKIPRKHNKIDGLASMVNAYMVLQNSGGFYKYKKRVTSRGARMSPYEMMSNIRRSGSILGGDK